MVMLACLGSLALSAQVVQKIGNNSMTISSSAALEIESTTKGLLLPRMNKVQMNAILSPADGLMLYCTDCTPVGIYLNISSVWSGLSLASASTVFADGTKNGFEGFYTTGQTVSANNKFSVTITNNSLSTITLSFAAADVVLSGTGLGTLTSGAPSVSSATLTAGQTQIVAYALAGAPIAGNVTANWSKVSLTATQTVTMTNFAANFTATCNAFNGSYVSGVALTSGNTVTVAIANTKAESTTVAFNTSDLALSGIAGLTVSAVSPATATINNGASTNVTYTLSGTPASTGTLTAAFTKNGLTCTGTKTITTGDASFASLPMDISLTSLNNGGSGDIQGVIDNSANKITYSIPYTSGVGSYVAYTSAAVAVSGQAGDSNNLTLTYPAGTFSSSGNITATVVVDGDGTFNVTKQTPGATSLIATLALAVNGANKGNVTLTAVTGPTGGNAIADGSRPTIVVPITSSTGKVWMDRNLGASRAGTSSADFYAYGGMYQWGRGNDGHASITWTSGSAGTAVNNSTSTISPTNSPGNGLFITPSANNGDWRNGGNDQLWQGVSGINNPCPTGYRVPTNTELQAEMTAYAISDVTTAYNSIFKFVVCGYRQSSGGIIAFTNAWSVWSSTINGGQALKYERGNGSAGFMSIERAAASSVRCIKN